MKILLPAGFIVLKLTGSFIDFMLGLSNSNVQDEQNFKTAPVRDSWTRLVRQIFKGVLTNSNHISPRLKVTEIPCNSRSRII